MPEPRPAPTVRAYTPTALPPVGARLAAFVAIIVGGICGGLITFAVVDLHCGGDERRAADILASEVPGAAAAPAPPEGGVDAGCDLVAGAAGLLGAVAGAGGVSVVSVLVLRAMAEWRRGLVLNDNILGEVAAGAAPQRTSRSRRKPSA